MRRRLALRDRLERLRPLVARVATILAGVLPLVALIAPNKLTHLTPGAFLRIPVEALVAVALVVVLPARPRRVVAVAGGACLGVLTVVKIIDLGFYAALDRPFHPVTDASLAHDGARFLTDSIGRAGALIAIAAAVLVLVALVTLTALSALRLSRVVIEHRRIAIRVVACLTPVWVSCAVLGAQIAPGVPVAARDSASLAYREALQVRTDLADRAAFAAVVAGEHNRVVGDGRLAALRGKDVAVVFVESYGRVAIEDPRIGPPIDALLDDGTRRLASAGFESRSAFLTSPTLGAGSLLAHSTLQSGLWVDSPQRYQQLVSTDRLTLSRAFHDAGWRSLAVVPGMTGDWPESRFFGYDQVYDAYHLGYHGPRFSFVATMPDQYALLAFDRLERAVPNRPPLMAQIVLTCSHAPFEPLPHPVGWDQVGDGSIFDPDVSGPSDPADIIISRNPARVRLDYQQSIEYSLNSLISYLQTFGDDKLVLIFVGDHQPAPVVSGPNPSRDVPISIVTRDHAVLDRIAGWQWQTGLRPDPHAPTWPMDTFRDRFLTTFGSSPPPADVLPPSQH
jgi:hypothetical protein